MTCGKCDRGNIPDDSLYCPGCGRPLADLAETPQTTKVKTSKDMPDSCRRNRLNKLAFALAMVGFVGSAIKTHDVTLAHPMWLVFWLVMCLAGVVLLFIPDP